MRVTCDACGTRYAIADERVQGRSVKIKCKKCGASVPVGAPAGADPGWTALLDDGEQRPVTLEQLAELYRAGAVHDDTYVWKEGMADWQALGENEQAKAQLAAALEPAAEVAAEPVVDPTPEPGAAAPERARRAVNGPRVDLFGAPGARPEGQGPPRAGARGAVAEASPVPARAGASPSWRPRAEAANGEGANGEGAAGAPGRAGPASRRAGGEAAGATGPASTNAAPSSRSPGAGERGVTASLSGSRNDDSVLFSVATLAGATTKKGPAPAPKGSSEPPAAAEAPATTEASGMIDMRILAAANGKAAPKKEERRDDRVDDLMSMGPSGSLFGSTFASPLLAPPPLEAPPPPPPPEAPVPASVEVPPAFDVGVGRASDSSGAAVGAAGRRGAVPRWALGAGAIALGLLGVVGVSSFVRSKPEPEAPAVVTERRDEGERRAQAAPSDGGAAEATPPAGEAPKEAAEAPKEAAEIAAAAEPHGGRKGRHDDEPGGGKHRRRDREEKREEKREEAEQRRAEQEKQAAESRAKAEPAAAPPPPAAAAPQAAAAGPPGTAPFDRGVASAALSSAAGGVAACKKADGPAGSGRVAVTFGPSGSVTDVVLEGPPFAGTPVGACLAAKFRGAKVPPFAGAAITVKKSFSLN
jgi:predicted Zn finger-like uncharacterized protein